MAKAKKHKVHVYGTYRFLSKDPVIDHLHTTINDSKMTYAAISETSGVSTSTIHNWIHGGTKKPQHATVMAVYRACGLTLKAVPYNGKDDK
jgi:DNA-binding phage protein